MRRKSGMDDEGRVPSALVYQRLSLRPIRSGESIDAKIGRLNERDKANQLCYEDEERLRKNQRWSQNVEQHVRKREASLRRQQNVWICFCLGCVCLALLFRVLG